MIRGQLAMVPAARVREAWCERLVETFSKFGVASILEVGCGDGNNLPILRRSFPRARLHGVDVSPKRIEFARNFAGHRELDLGFSEASATDLPFARGEFDAVYSMYCLEHLPREFPDAIREMCRVARRCVVLVEPIPEHRGPAQWIYAFAADFLRGVPDFLHKEGLAVESVELLDDASVPLNLASMITIRTDGATKRENSEQSLHTA